MNKISWYPGHINKFLYDIEKLFQKIDFFILVVDARAPWAYYDDFIRRIIRKKETILIYSKTDLTEKNYEKLSFKNISFSLESHKSWNGKSLVKLLNEKFKFKTGLILGYPNVGKSTLLNKLTTKSSQIVKNSVGVTKRMRLFSIKSVLIIDSPGAIDKSYSTNKELFCFFVFRNIKLDKQNTENIYNIFLKFIFKFRKDILQDLFKKNFTSFFDFNNHIYNEEIEFDFFYRKVINVSKYKFSIKIEDCKKLFSFR